MKLFRTLTLVLAATVGITMARPASAQDTRTITLRFRKAGDTVAIRGAQITIDHTIEAGLTDANGMVKVPDLEDGGHIVEAVAKGYQAFFDKFASSANATTIDLEILAVVAPPKPKGVATTLTVAGFDARRLKAQGRFFTPAQMKAVEGRPLANVLKINAGAFLAAGPNAESFLASKLLSKPSAPCYAAVIRDGLQLYPYEGATPPDLDKIFTDDLSRIELYTTTPAELKDAGRCGALVLWSR